MRQGTSAPSAVGDVKSVASGVPEQTTGTHKTLLSSGSLLGALAASSCCLMPFVLFSVGVSGAWLGSLSRLFPYQPYFAGLTFVLLAGGYYMVYRKPKAVECEPGTYCARPVSDRINKVVLWAATALVVVALAFPYAMPRFMS